jgi:outer membrane protein assembly factor BamB
MTRSIIILAFSIFSVSLRAQDASTPEGQKAIDHRLRFYEGTAIKNFSAKTTDLTIEGQKFSSVSPALFNGVVYIGTDSGCIYTVTPAEIKRLCKLESGAAIEGAVAVTNDNVYAGFTNKLFAAFSRSDGKMLWKYETKGPVITTPLVHDRMVYFTTSNGFVYALDAESGSFKWRFNVLSKASSPVFDHDVLFVGNDRQRLYAINTKRGIEAGNELWHFDGAGGQPVINESDVYATAFRGAIYSIDRTSGREVWHFNGDLSPGTTDLALANYTLVYGNGRRIIAMDSRAGEGFKWQKELPRTIDVAPIIAGDAVYAACSDGKMYVLDLASGNELSHFDLGFTPQSSLAYGKNGIIYPNSNKILFISGE